MSASSNGNKHPLPPLLPLKKEILAAFRCQKSGNCCITDGYVYISKKELRNMAEFLSLSPAAFRKTYVVPVEGHDAIATPTHRPRCFLDDNNRCQIYSVRPSYCRQFPNCQAVWSDEASIKKDVAMCPGLQAAVKNVLG